MMLNKDGVNLRVTVSSEKDEKLKQQINEVLKDYSEICNYLNDLLEKHLGKFADIFDIVASIKSYHLRNRIDPRFGPNVLTHDKDELIHITKNNLLKVYKVFINKDYPLRSDQADSEIIQDIYRTPVMLNNADTDCYRLKSTPTIEELVNVTDFFAICMHNAHMPYTYIFAARRSPLEKHYAELFTLFNVHDGAENNEVPSQPKDATVAIDKDAYSCYFLKWMLMYLNSFVSTQYKIFSNFLPLLEKKFAEICLLIKVQMNIVFDQRLGSYTDKSIDALPIEKHHIEPLVNFMEITNIFEVFKQPNTNAYRLSLLLREIASDAYASQHTEKHLHDSARRDINNVLKMNFEIVKYAVRKLYVKRAEMFNKLPGLRVFSEILLSSSKSDNASDPNLEDILTVYIPMIEATVEQLKQVKTFGEWSNNKELMEYSAFLCNINTCIGISGSHFLHGIRKLLDYCLNQMAPKAILLTALQSEREQQEEELYKTPSQSPGNRSRSNSITLDQAVSKNSSPRLRADKALISSGDTTVSKIPNRDSTDKFLGTISNALKRIIPSSSSTKEQAISPRACDSAPELATLAGSALTQPLPILQKPTG